MRRASLTVPAHELNHVAAADIRKALDELLDGRGFAVVAREIEVHPRRNPSRPIRVRIMRIFRRPFYIPWPCRNYRSRYSFPGAPDAPGSRIFGELRGAQPAHVLDALDRALAHVGGKFLSRKTVRPSLRQAGTSRGR